MRSADGYAERRAQRIALQARGVLFHLLEGVRILRDELLHRAADLWIVRIESLRLEVSLLERLALRGTRDLVGGEPHVEAVVELADVARLPVRAGLGKDHARAARVVAGDRQMLVRRRDADRRLRQLAARGVRSACGRL